MQLQKGTPVFSRKMVLHFRGNDSGLQEQGYAILFQVCPSPGGVHVLLHVEVTFESFEATDRSLTHFAR